MSIPPFLLPVGVRITLGFLVRPTHQQSYFQRD